MIVLSLLDADLLVYDGSDFYSAKTDVRKQALLDHLNRIADYRQKIPMSDELEALLWQNGFWNPSRSHELRKVLQANLQRCREVVITRVTGESTSFVPQDAVCQTIKDSNVISEWKSLLGSCAFEASTKNLKSVVATWQTSGINPKALYLTVVNDENPQNYDIPLIRDNQARANQFDPLEFWPDYAKCAELYYLANLGTNDSRKKIKKCCQFTLNLVLREI